MYGGELECKAGIMCSIYGAGELIKVHYVDLKTCSALMGIVDYEGFLFVSLMI